MKKKKTFEFNFSFGNQTKKSKSYKVFTSLLWLFLGACIIYVDKTYIDKQTYWLIQGLFSVGSIICIFEFIETFISIFSSEQHENIPLPRVMDESMNELSVKIHEANKAKGFWPEDPKERNFGELIALMHSELSEALEADRKGREADLSHFFTIMNEEPNAIFTDVFKALIKDTKEDELADAVIRILDYCGAMGIDIERHIQLKLQYNSTRPAKHGKNY